MNDLAQYFKRILLACLSCAFIFLPYERSYAQFDKIVDLDKAWVTFQLGRYLDANELFQEIVDSTLVDERSRENLKISALAMVLSSIAFERMDDARAYQSWSQAISYLLEASSSWETFQKEFKTYYESEATLLNQNNIEGAASGVAVFGGISEKAALLILQLENTLSLTQYAGPRGGLRQVVKPSTTDNPLPARQYIARPKLTVRSSSGEGDDAISDTADRVDGVAINNQEDLQEQTLPEAEFLSSGQSQIEVGEQNNENVFDINARSIRAEVEDLPIEPNSVPEQESTLRRLGMRGVAGLAFAGDEKILIRQAQNAWHYFVNNTDERTGMVNSTHDYSYTTMWDTATSLAALTSAHKLGIIDVTAFELRLKKILQTLNTMPFYNDELPNREYRTDLAQMVDHANTLSEKGSGWSAVGIGRLLIWLKIIETWYPDFKVDVGYVIKRMNLSRLLGDKELIGAYHNGVIERLFDEGRLGYEQYAAVGLALWRDVDRNFYKLDKAAKEKIYDEDVLVDPRPGGYLLMDPFGLIALETGAPNTELKRLLDTLYNVQKRHSDTIKHPVAVAETALHKPPWVIYPSIFSNGKPWQTLGTNGRHYEEFSGYSTHGIFLLDAIFADTHSTKMKEATKALVSPGYGYYSGKTYHGETIRALSANTNGVILESILYSLMGSKPFLSK